MSDREVSGPPRDEAPDGERAGAPPSDGDRATAPTGAPPGVPRTAGLAALLVCLALVALAEILLAKEIAGRDQARFDRAVETIERRILGRVDTCEALLRGGAGLFAATEDQVDATAFRRFARRTRLELTHPEIQGIGFSLVASAERAAGLPAELERQGLAGVELQPPGAGDRHAIVFIEPLDRRNREALGFDMHSEAVRREAMERARDSGRPALSGKVKLVQEIDADTQPGFLLYVPVYRGGALPETIEARRAALHGFIFAPIRAHDFFRRLFEGSDRIVEFAIHDGDPEAEDSLLFGPRDLAGARTAQRVLEVNGGAWTIRYASNQRFDELGSRRDLIVLGVIGLLASLAVLVLVRRQAAARQAEVVARHKAEKRRAQAEALAAELVALSDDFVKELERRRAEDGAPGTPQPGSSRGQDDAG